jgi:hypothetical protein
MNNKLWKRLKGVGKTGQEAQGPCQCCQCGNYKRVKRLCNELMDVFEKMDEDELENLVVGSKSFKDLFYIMDAMYEFYTSDR